MSAIKLNIIIILISCVISEGIYLDIPHLKTVKITHEQELDFESLEDINFNH